MAPTKLTKKEIADLRIRLEEERVRAGQAAHHHRGGFVRGHAVRPPATSVWTTSRPTPARRRSSARRTSRSRTTSATSSHKIDRALKRIDEGTYGICDICGKPIEKARIKALAYVDLCIKDAQAQSRR